MPAFWWPVSQLPQASLTGVLRAEGDPLFLTAAAVRAVHSIDPGLPLAKVRTMDDIARLAPGERNMANRLMETFAALALLLAVVGIYGLLAYVVEQRQQEFGIRLALGASRLGIASLVLKSGLLQAGLGGAVGVLLAPAAGRFLMSLLYGVTPLDWLPLVMTVAVVLCAAIFTSLIPAAAAARSQPAATLRAE